MRSANKSPIEADNIIIYKVNLIQNIHLICLVVLAVASRHGTLRARSPHIAYIPAAKHIKCNLHRLAHAALNDSAINHVRQNEVYFINSAASRISAKVFIKYRRGVDIAI